MDCNLSDIQSREDYDVDGALTVLKIMDGDRRYCYKVKGHQTSEAWIDYMKIIFLYELKLNNIKYHS